MTNVVEFKPRNKTYEAKSDDFALHDFLLDAIEEHNPDGGIVILVDGGDVSVATALDSLELAEDALLAALEVIQAKGKT